MLKNRSSFFIFSWRGRGGGACGKTMVERKCRQNTFLNTKLYKNRYYFFIIFLEGGRAPPAPPLDPPLLSGLYLALVERICNIFSSTCALPERSMEIWPKGFLSMLNSKIAGTTTSFQQFPLKNWNFKMAATKYVFVNNSVLSTPIALILVFLPTFGRSRNPIKHITIMYVDILIIIYWFCYIFSQIPVIT